MRKSELSEEIEIVDYRTLKIQKYFDGKIKLDSIEVICIVKSLGGRKSEARTLMRIEYMAFVFIQTFPKLFYIPVVLRIINSCQTHTQKIPKW